MPRCSPDTYRFAGGPAPVAPPKYGSARALREWREFGKAAIAWAVACGLLGAAIFLVALIFVYRSPFLWLIPLVAAGMALVAICKAAKETL